MSARPDLIVAASLLAQGRTIDALSRLLTALALLALVLLAGFAAQPSLLAWAILGLAILSGLAQTYLAIRVGFDAALFRGLAADQASDLVGLDAALIRQGLLPEAKAGRALAARIAGARALLHRQALMLMLQVTLLLVGAILGALR